MGWSMTSAELLWRQMNYIEPFDEQTTDALEIMDCGTAVGRTTVVPLTSDEAIKDFVGIAGALA